MLKGFKEFIAKGNAVDLAVGVVIGAAFGVVVNSITKGIIDPLIGLILPGDVKDLAPGPSPSTEPSSTAA